VYDFDFGSEHLTLQIPNVLHLIGFGFCSFETQYNLNDLPARWILINFPNKFSINFLMASGCKVVINLSVPLARLQ